MINRTKTHIMRLNPVFAHEVGTDDGKGASPNAPSAFRASIFITFSYPQSTFIWWQEVENLAPEVDETMYKGFWTLALPPNTDHFLRNHVAEAWYNLYEVHGKMSTICEKLGWEIHSL